MSRKRVATEIRNPEFIASAFCVVLGVIPGIDNPLAILRDYRRLCICIAVVVFVTRASAAVVPPAAECRGVKVKRPGRYR